MASGSEKMINGILESLTLYCPSIRLPFISMAAFGICMTAQILYGLNPTQIIGLINSLITRIVTKGIMTK